MKTLKIAILVISLAAAGSSIAAGMDAMAGMPASKAQPNSNANADFTEGEVRAVNKETGKVTLKHGEIKNLDMPGMTMVFGVKDKALLDKVQPGDKVKFRAISESGKLIVTEIQSNK